MLAGYVYDVIKAANSSGDGVVMLKAQLLATALNAYVTPALATTSVAVDGSRLGTGDCITVAQLLSATTRTSRRSPPPSRT